jgi:hypothetical protein
LERFIYLKTQVNSVPEWPDNLSEYIEIGWLKRAYSSEGMDGPWQYISAVRERIGWINLMYRLYLFHTIVEELHRLENVRLCESITSL